MDLFENILNYLDKTIWEEIKFPLEEINQEGKSKNLKIFFNNNS